MTTEKTKILLVDNEPMILDGLKARLRRNYDVLIAEGGDKGLSLLGDAGPFAVVVSDMRMPGMNGAEFLSKVKIQSPTRCGCC